MKIVAIIGHKKTGKTRLIEQLIPILRGRGHRVGTVKHAPHTPVQEDKEADSARHRAAGAERTLLIGEDGAALFFESEGIEGAIEEAFPGVDIVLVEGYKDGPFPKIEVYRNGGEEPLCETREVATLIGNAPPPAGVDIPVLARSDLRGIARLIERL